jgi:hypothetical protein
VKQAPQVQQEQLVHKDFQLLGPLDHKELPAQRVILDQPELLATQVLKEQLVQPGLRVLPVKQVQQVQQARQVQREVQDLLGQPVHKD